jgi:hypothetical protein
MTAKKVHTKRIADKGERRAVSPFRSWVDRTGDLAISELCQHIVEGGHLAGFCKAKEFAYVTVLDWINADPRRTELYARAREDRADLLADETIAIADEAQFVQKVGEDGETVEVTFDSVAVQRNKLRVDARKWYAAKLKPRSYGEKVHAELTGKDGKDLPLAPAGVLVVPGLMADTAAWSQAAQAASIKSDG